MGSASPVRQARKGRAGERVISYTAGRVGAWLNRAWSKLLAHWGVNASIDDVERLLSMIDRDEALFRAANCTQPGRRGLADSSSRRRARSHLPRENDLGTSAFCAAIPARATPAAPRAGSTTTRASGPFSTPASGAPSPSVTASRTGTERQWREPGASGAWRQGGRGGLEYVDKPGPRKRRRRCFLRLYGKCPRRSCHDSCASCCER